MCLFLALAVYSGVGKLGGLRIVLVAVALVAGLTVEDRLLKSPGWVCNYTDVNILYLLVDKHSFNDFASAWKPLYL